MRYCVRTLPLIITACVLYKPTSAVADPTAADYFPLSVGNRWVYESSEGADATPVVESWEVVRQEGRAFVVRVQQPFVTGDGLEEIFEVNAESVQRRVPDAKTTEPQLILKAPAAVGDSWQGADGRYTITAAGETVTVPAGTFDNCLEITRRNKESRVTIASTYAPGVGMIQREETFPIIGGFGSGGDFEAAARGRTVLRLKSWEVKK
ncbi:MAG TPA: hypothetical protein VNN62_12220 [Methylomirabilota bacterium]|jgi:hypothetical protein|nr:hypothetical protein [Methylomirabilota bacterium]